VHTFTKLVGLEFGVTCAAHASTVRRCAVSEKGFSCQ
jgi:hypothetical protein